MKRNLFALISVAALGLTAVGASVAQIRAPDPAPPEAVSRYMVGTRLGYITCSNKYRDYVAQWDKFSFKNEGKTTVAGSPPSDAGLSSVRAGDIGQGPRDVSRCSQAGNDGSREGCLKELPDCMGGVADDAGSARR